MRLHAALTYIPSHSTFMAVVIFSPFLLTNKIVIIEGITLSCEAVFKWLFFLLLLLFPVVGAGMPHAQRITFFEKRACVDTYFSIF